MINTKNIREFYRRLNPRYGVTELVVIDPGKKGVIATGFFDNENDFVSWCQRYNGKYNIYAGRNPRPGRLFSGFESRNRLEARIRRRAKDTDITHITAISLDIDPIRPKGTSSTNNQHKTAIDFASRLQKDSGGWVDDSGNGAYLWIPFANPIKIDDDNREEIKEKCRLWQSMICKAHHPDRYGLRIDGCFDLSRIKKVIGTMSVKGKIHRLSRFVKTEETPGDKIRNIILSFSLQTKKKTTPSRITLAQNLPSKFLSFLHNNPAIQELWLTPDEQNDTSLHDWKLGCTCIQAGITSPYDIAAILMFNPFGKFQRDRRYEYIKTTVNKLVVENESR